MFLVDIMGGFGNQLFQIAFAMYLKKHGFKPKLFIFNNSPSNNHNFYMINHENFNLQTISPLGEFILKKMNSTNLFRENLFNTYDYENTFQIKKLEFEDKKLITSFNSFWQDKYFVDEVFDEFKSGLLKTPIFNEGFNKPKTKGSTMLHIRRGDHAFFLPLSYYEDALLQARKIDGFTYDIYTDDPEWVKAQKNFTDAKNIYEPQQDEDIKLDTYKTFSKMLNYENYIISNSSYSWWAAKIAECDNSNIFYPYPYWPSLEPDIFYDNWIRVNRHIES